jgi:hypothetical protein
VTFYQNLSYFKIVMAGAQSRAMQRPTALARAVGGNAIQIKSDVDNGVA